MGLNNKLVAKVLINFLMDETQHIFALRACTYSIYTRMSELEDRDVI